MSTADAPAPSTRTNLASSVLSQGLVAGTSLVLQWVALWRLGRTGLGAYSILNAGWLVVITAVHTGWVGDPITLMDRHDPTTRSTLLRAAAWGTVLAGIAAAIGAGINGSITALTAVMFGAAMAAWVVEEAFRRLMMACFMFRSLAINDAVYGLVAIGTALALVATTGITLTGLVFAMLCGSSASIAVGMIQVPRAEWWPKTSAVSDWSALSRIAVWRSGQLSMRPATLLTVRVGVEAVSSAAVLGLFEAGRLVVAAVMTLANGLGAFALPYFKRRFDRGELTPGFAARSVRLAFIAGLAALPSMAVMVPLVGVADDGSTLPVALIGSWALFAVLSCANAVAVNALAVWGRNRELFLARVVDAAVAVPLSLVFAARGWVEWLPCCLAAGMVIGTGGLFGLASRQRPNSSRPETQIDLRRPVEAADAFDSSGIGVADDIKDPGNLTVSVDLRNSVDSADPGDSTGRGGVGERRP